MADSVACAVRIFLRRCRLTDVAIVPASAAHGRRQQAPLLALTLARAGQHTCCSDPFSAADFLREVWLIEMKGTCDRTARLQRVG